MLVRLIVVAIMKVLCCIGKEAVCDVPVLAELFFFFLPL